MSDPNSPPAPYYNPVHLSPEEWQAVERFADLLGETQPQPILLIARIIRFCGLDFAQRIIDETFAIEQKGGLKRDDGKGYRTTGGIFFYLAKNQAPREDRHRAFRQGNPDRPPTPPPPRFSWKKRRKIITPLTAEPGSITSTQVTLIGRPDSIEEASGFVTLEMCHQANLPTIPVGVPNQVTPTTGPHTVYVLNELWHKVVDSLANEGRKLRIQGICSYDAEASRAVVYATAVSPVKMKKDKRKSQPDALP